MDEEKSCNDLSFIFNQFKNNKAYNEIFNDLTTMSSFALFAGDIEAFVLFNHLKSALEDRQKVENEITALVLKIENYIREREKIMEEEADD